MPRRKHSSTARSEKCLDGSILSADELLFIASQVGQVWKRFRRRQWPNELKDSIASVLLELRAALVPMGTMDEFGSSERTPSDVRGIAELMKCLATHNTFLENKPAQTDTKMRSQSSPPEITQNIFTHDVQMLELQVVADAGNNCMTDWEFGDYLAPEYSCGGSYPWYASYDAAEYHNPVATFKLDADDSEEDISGIEMDSTYLDSHSFPNTSLENSRACSALDVELNVSTLGAESIAILDSRVAAHRNDVFTGCMNFQYALTNWFKEFDGICERLACRISQLADGHALACRPWDDALEQFDIETYVGHYETPTLDAIEDAVTHVRSLVKSCITLDHSLFDKGQCSYEDWIEAITETSFKFDAWDEHVPLLYHLKHLEGSKCDHVEWVLIKWSTEGSLDCGEGRSLEDGPDDFLNTMLGHKFNIKSPEYVVSFVSQRICYEPLAKAVNVCIGNYDDEQSDNDRSSQQVVATGFSCYTS